MTLKYTRTALARNLLLLFFLLYYSQGVFFKSGSIISQFSLVGVLGIASLYLLKLGLVKQKFNSFLASWTFLFFVNVLGYLLIADSYNSLVFGMFKRVLVCFLGFYPFFYFSKLNILKTKHLLLFMTSFLVVCIFQFYRNRNLIVDEFDVENVVNNVSYGFVILIPFLFLIKNRIFGIVVLFIIWFFVILGAKRGALVSSSLGTLVYLFYLLSSAGYGSIIKRMKNYFLTFSGVVCAGYFAYKQLVKNDYFIRRLQLMAEGESSGRSDIYSTVISEWMNGDFLNLLFGFGFASSLEITQGSFAHNDWLELLANFGALGVVFYLFLFISLLYLSRNKVLSFQYRMMAVCIMVLWFFITLVSMWYTSLLAFTQVMLLGYLFGKVESIKSDYTNNIYHIR